MQTFLSTELAKSHSDADRVFVYQRAFDLISREFQICRPLLERIKKQYDDMSQALLTKKRMSTTTEVSATTTEDRLSEELSQLRRAKAQEYQNKKRESERLIDEMTSLRLRRSELLKSCDVLEKRRRQLKERELELDIQMMECNSRVKDISEEVKGIEKDIANKKYVSHDLKDHISETDKSANDLLEKAKQLSNALCESQSVQNELKAQVDELTLKESEERKMISNARREIEKLREEIAHMRERKAVALKKGPRLVTK